MKKKDIRTVIDTAKEKGIKVFTSVDDIISELDILLQQSNVTPETKEPKKKINKHTLSYRKSEKIRKIKDKIGHKFF